MMVPSGMKVLDSYCVGGECWVIGCSDLWCKDVRVYSTSMSVAYVARQGRYCNLYNYYLNRYNSVVCRFGADHIRDWW